MTLVVAAVCSVSHYSSAALLVVLGAVLTMSWTDMIEREANRPLPQSGAPPGGSDAGKTVE